MVRISWPLTFQASPRSRRWRVSWRDVFKGQRAANGVPVAVKHMHVSVVLECTILHHHVTACEGTYSRARCMRYRSPNVNADFVTHSVGLVCTVTILQQMRFGSSSLFFAFQVLGNDVEYFPDVLEIGHLKTVCILARYRGVTHLIPYLRAASHPPLAIVPEDFSVCIELV